MHTEIIWVLFAMLLVAWVPKLLFPSEADQPTSHELMTGGDFWLGFRQWSRQCGWYLLVLIGFGAYFPSQWRLGAVYLAMLFVMWIGWAGLCASGMAPKR